MEDSDLIWSVNLRKPRAMVIMGNHKEIEITTSCS